MFDLLHCLFADKPRAEPRFGQMSDSGGGRCDLGGLPIHWKQSKLDLQLTRREFMEAAFCSYISSNSYWFLQKVPTEEEEHDVGWIQAFIWAGVV